MKLVALVIAQRNGKLIDIAAELSNFGIFERGTVKEVIIATSKIFINKFAANTKNSVPYEDYICYVDDRNDFGGVVFTDKEYPERIAVKCLTEMMNEYIKKTQGLPGEAFPEINGLLQKYSDTRGHDKIMDVQNQVDNIIPIMHQNIDAVIGNSAKIEDLLQHSDDLSAKSKLFLKNTKRAKRRCCILQ
ncbi:synaptobrevin domain-containing protein [Tieghemostelium lacteum]|uniref:Synaptobrevin domain-containing protein n=1 Tax=Tieghemostelium lacteum TaxID=361077 RepID=A0A152A953_TIELA|nr:synaptobrevin domain-containing protein [Tieghemostelium lacteum]|eukprot:KYR02750.1 synaptobrevin domain-containing protein [Tieghemostelium lacteum]